MFLVLKVSDSFASKWPGKRPGLPLSARHEDEGALLRLLSTLAQERDTDGSGSFSLIGEDGSRHEVALTDLDRLDLHLTARDICAVRRPPEIRRLGSFRIELKDSFITSIPEAIRARLLTFEDPDEQSFGAQPARCFSLGRVLMSPGAEALLADDPALVDILLTRHRTGEWGCIGAYEQQQNYDNLQSGWCILSAYSIMRWRDGENLGDNTLWVATERTPGVTTMLLSREY